MEGRLPQLRGEGQGVGVSAPQTLSQQQLDARVAQAIDQLNDAGSSDLAAAVLAALARPQHIEVVMVRDPDHATEVDLFINGRPLREAAQVSLAEFDIDPGAGYVWTDWVESRASDIAAASPTAAAALREAALRNWDFIEEMPDRREERESDLDAAITKAHLEIGGRFRPGIAVRQPLRCNCCHRYGTIAEFQPPTGDYQTGWWVDWIGGGRTLEQAWELKEV